MPPIEYFGVMIPILGIGLGFFAVWTDHKRKLVKLQAAATAKAPPTDPEQAREVKELRERVGVLERIVTDGGYDLATRIEALRDERPVPVAIEQAPVVERLG
jgi:uncharacterized protein with GYD domain